MGREQEREVNAKEQKKLERLKELVGKEFCACGGNQLQCGGICRESHTNPKTGKVECEEMYRITNSDIRPEKREKRGWKFGRQDRDDHDNNKWRRQQKLMRDKP